jgi:hypothetical protein
MGNQEGQELDRGDELVVDAEPRVNLRTLVVDHAVLAVAESSEAHRRPLHVGEEALEARSVVGLELSVPSDVEARVLPGPHDLRGLGQELPPANHHLEEPPAEDLLESGEVHDGPRLVHRYGPHWRILLLHLVLFGFIYPGERGKVPEAVLSDHLARLRAEATVAPPAPNVCRGTLISREQFLVDVMERGFADPRLPPYGTMRSEDVEHWTQAIGTIR